MSVSPIASMINTYSPNHAAESAKAEEKKTSSDVKSNEPSTDTVTTSKKLTADQLQDMQEQQLLSFKQMLYGMLNTQAGHASNANGIKLNKDLFSMLNIGNADAATSASSISKDGQWGVNAVATRIMDMAVALSGGDSSKIDVLRNAVNKGFEAAGLQWGGTMPSITGETHAEINKRFDYWEKNGSLDGYSMD